MAGKQLHVVMYPWLAFGHIIPYFHLSKELAQRGHKVTFVLPSKAKARLESMNLYPSQITLYPINVPHVEPLPLGVETVSDIPLDLHTYLATAFDLTRPEFESVVTNACPDLLFYDFAHWVPQVASKMGKKSVCYNVVCASGLALTKPELIMQPSSYKSLSVEMTFLIRVITALESGDVIALRTCREVEGKSCDDMGTNYNKPVLLSGPVLSEPIKGAVLEEQWACWLNRFLPSSVVFCAFGSQFVFDKYQFQEVLLGFELTRRPFLVALKPPTGCATVEEAFPEGFLDRVGDRGQVTGNWVQQTALLEHPSVGCFVNHCGFGTMWESLLSDNQLVLIPQLDDQVLNAKMMADELNVAVQVERGDDGNWVTKESLCKAVNYVMDEKSEIGTLIKKNHQKWRDILGRPGFMSEYVSKFIKDLQALVE